MTLLDLVFPPVCLHCSRPLRWLCERCTQDLFPLLDSRPPPLLTYPGLKEVRSAYAYEGPAESFVKNVKYNFVSAAIETQASLLDLQLGKVVTHWNLDALVPVPLHPRRQAWRGFNQSEQLCLVLGKLWKIPVLSLLERRTWEHSQAGSNKHDRQTLRNHFQLQSTLGQGKRLALIDDVITTGSTLSDCARELEKSSPSSLVGITFAAA